MDNLTKKSDLIKESTKKRKKKKNNNNAINNNDDDKHKILLEKLEELIINENKLAINDKNNDNDNDSVAVKIIHNNITDISKFIKEQLINKEILEYIKPVEIKFRYAISNKLKQHYNNNIIFNIKMSRINKFIKNTTNQFLFYVECKLNTLIKRNILQIQTDKTFDIYIHEQYILNYETLKVACPIIFTYTISLFN